MSDEKKIGPLGEELVVKFLVKRGYKILDRNYRRPWGELDIVAEKKGKIHFIEVKALARNVSDETKQVARSPVDGKAREVSDETERNRTQAYIRSGVKKDIFRPEDNVGHEKTKRLSRIIQTYLMGKYVSDETPWQFDVATVLMDTEKRVARVNLLEDIILERSR